MINVFISPGHWEDTWKKGEKTYKGFKEFNHFNSPVANYLFKALSLHSEFRPKILEYDNGKQDMTLQQRIDHINKYCGRYLPSQNIFDDVVVSIHANYNENKEIRGVEYYYGSEHGKKLCNMLKNHSIVNDIQHRTMFQCKYNTWTQFGIVLDVKPLSILCEFGYFSNDEDRKILYTDKYHQQCATSIYLALCEFYNVLPIFGVEPEKVLTIPEILNEISDNPDTWLKGISTLKKMVDSGYLGDIECFNWIDDLIGKLYYKEYHRKGGEK